MTWAGFLRTLVTVWVDFLGTSATTLADFLGTLDTTWDFLGVGGSRLLEAKTRVGLESVACLGLIKSSSWMDLVSVGLVVWMTGGRRKLELELGDTDEGRFRYS